MTARGLLSLLVPSILGLAALSGCSRQLPVTPNSVKTGATLERSGPTLGTNEGCTISGTVFVDGNGDEVFDPKTETGVAGVTVRLDNYYYKGPLTTTTDENGYYAFKVDVGEAPEGGGCEFTVRIELKTAEKDFNEQLDASFDPIGKLEVCAEPCAKGTYDFGFTCDIEEVVDDVRSGELPTDGEPVKYWKKVFHAGLKNSQKHPEYTRTELLGLLDEIEGFFAPDPFQFTAGQELEEAYLILKRKPKTAYEALVQQLFVAELNAASDRGLDDEALSTVLLQWGESVVIANQPGAVPQAAPGVGRLGEGDETLGRPPVLNDDEVHDAAVLFSIINRARGGGDVPQ